MTRFIPFPSVSLLLIAAALSLNPVAGAFERVEAENFAKGSFVFPDDIRDDGPNLLFLSIATDQKNGEYQGDALMVWHEALEERSIIPELARPWHFPVMESPPFFVRGLIRRGIAASFQGKLPPEQGAVLFIDDLNAFAGAAGGWVVDGEPTLVLFKDNKIRAVFKGQMTPAGIDEIVTALQDPGTDAAVSQSQ